MATPPTSSKPLEYVTPSKLIDLECPLRVAFGQAALGTSPDEPSDAARVGETAHRAIELVVIDQLDIDSAWTLACNEDKQKHAGLPTVGRSRARITRKRLERKLPQLLERLEGVAVESRIAEDRLESHDKQIVGYPDLVFIHDGCATVIDHKTGLVLDEERVREHYERQLLIYAALVVDNFDVDRLALALLSLKEGLVAIEPETGAIDAAAVEARRMLSSFNERTPGEQPALPAQETCRWCRFAASCDSLWGVITPAWAETTGAAVTGEVAETTDVAANGRFAIKLVDVTGTIEADEALINLIPADELDVPAPGQVLRVLDLRHTADDPVVLQWTEQTSGRGRVQIA